MANHVTLKLESLEKGLRFSYQAGSGTQSVTDSGPGLIAPSPVEMLIAALGACHAMDVIEILRKKRLKVLSYEVRVTGERREPHPRAFTRIDVLHMLRSPRIPVPALIEAIRLTDTKYCTVHASLNEAIEITSRYEIRPETGDTPVTAGVAIVSRGGIHEASGA
jgi:putative redox protein